MDPSQSEWQYWMDFQHALNATGRPVRYLHVLFTFNKLTFSLQIYYSICPKTLAPDTGTAIPYYNDIVYSPPANWTLAMHQEVANSVLVEYPHL